MLMGMQLIENPKGVGTVISKKGGSQAEYELDVWQDQTPVATMDNPNAAGLNQIRGWVHPVHCAVGEIATLELQDGRKLKFFYLTNASAEITAIGGFE